MTQSGDRPPVPRHVAEWLAANECQVVTEGFLRGVVETHDTALDLLAGAERWLAETNIGIAADKIMGRNDTKLAAEHLRKLIHG